MHSRLRILMVFPGMLTDLPPLLASARVLVSRGVQVEVVGVGGDPSSLERLRRTGVAVADLGEARYPRGPIGRALLRPRFLRLLRTRMRRGSHDVVWFHGGHAMAYRPWVGGVLKDGMLVVAHAHELYDREPRLRRAQERLLCAADHLVVPTESRGWILKASSGTSARFTVMPNRPSGDSVEGVRREVERGETARRVFRTNGGAEECGRFVIHQGLVGRGRCVLELVEAFKQLDDGQLGMIVLGTGSGSTYEREVARMASGDRRVALVPRIPPPSHLEVTRGCDVGVMLYAPTSLNNVFCAPNRLYEYAEMGLGIVMPGYPELSLINDRWKLGVTCDPTEPTSIAAALDRALARPQREWAESGRAFLTASPRLEEACDVVLSELLARRENGARR